MFRGSLFKPTQAILRLRKRSASEGDLPKLKGEEKYMIDRLAYSFSYFMTQHYYTRYLTNKSNCLLPWLTSNPEILNYIKNYDHLKVLVKVINDKYKYDINIEFTPEDAFNEAKALTVAESKPKSQPSSPRRN